MLDSSPLAESECTARGTDEALLVLGQYLKEVGKHVVEDMVYTKRVWEWLHSFLRLDGKVWCSAYRAWIASVAFFCYIVLGLHIYGINDSWRLILYISFF